MSDRLSQLMRFYDQDPTDAFCTYGIAMEHNKVGRHDQAVQWLDRTLEIDPNHAYAHYQKAVALAEMGQRADAQAAIDAGLEAAKRSGDAHAAEELAALAKTM
ncbi:tetratricopeptide repeat protein [Planctomycetales bacterium ZRK34]|nr:tetratricopeptide repeat protein [Planctomycetales bacterium ZRK34]